ncbi:hypothetical protein GCM10010399_78820 [Dactylosporangium fulvum]|uniref:Uncharacterized protein n=1 Tax=Dactylosporangium fulvum TaxID=53359 RepID=A0ABY5VXI8_9ACTN|nr:hypothetical protein [Dactylosporangium fulvum]UWP81193.1 hypothetical protein Dfulv_39710 [Dactylosporangium fulvum]
MALNDTLLAFADGNPIDVLRACPVLDKPATRALAERLFPGATVDEIGDVLLVDAMDPPEDVVHVGCFGTVDLVCSWRLTPRRPSELDPVVLSASERRNVLLHTAHCAAGWCSYGLWRDGTRVRALSRCGDPGVCEDEGERLPFEGDGGDEELCCRSLLGLFGFRCADEGRIDDVDPELIPVVAYRVSTAS